MLKILIIEDDILWQMKLQTMLEELGFVVYMSASLKEAKEQLETIAPDVILTDIDLPDGFSFSFFQNYSFSCPIIFITQFHSLHFLEQTRLIPHSSFYVKPFQSLTLYAAIRSANDLFKASKGITNKSIQIPIWYGQKKDIPLSSICWIEAERNYCTVQTPRHKYVQKISMTKLYSNLDERFVQVNKSVIVNKEFINRIHLGQNTITVNDRHFIIGRSYKQQFMDTIYNGR